MDNEEKTEGLHYRVYADQDDGGYKKFRTYPGAIVYLMQNSSPSVSELDGDPGIVPDDFYLSEIKKKIKRCQLVFQENEIGFIVSRSNRDDKTKPTRKYRKHGDRKDTISRILRLIEDAGKKKGIQVSRIILEICQSSDVSIFSVSPQYVYSLLYDLKRLKKVYCVNKIYRIND